MAEYYTKLWNMESCSFSFDNLSLIITNHSGTVNSEIYYHGKIIKSKTVVINTDSIKLGIFIDENIFCLLVNGIPFVLTKTLEKINIYDFVKDSYPSSLINLIYLLSPYSDSTPYINISGNSWIVHLTNSVNNLPKDFIKISNKSCFCSNLLSLTDYIRHNDNISSVIPNV
jgi:hypothetical protein